MSDPETTSAADDALERRLQQHGAGRRHQSAMIRRIVAALPPRTPLVQPHRLLCNHLTAAVGALGALVVPLLLGGGLVPLAVGGVLALITIAAAQQRLAACVTDTVDVVAAVTIAATVAINALILPQFGSTGATLAGAWGLSLIGVAAFAWSCRTTLEAGRVLAVRSGAVTAFSAGHALFSLL